MLTSAVRVAARRGVISSQVTAAAGAARQSLNPFAVLALRPAVASARSFTTSPEHLEAAVRAKKKAAPAAAPATKSAAATKKPAAKKSAAASAPKKKAAPKKKPAAKKAAPKKKKKAAKKAAKPKTAKPRKILTQEQQDTLQRIEWKHTSLLGVGPKLLPISPFNVWISEVAKGCEAGSIGAFSAKYKEVPEAELTRLHSIAEQNKTKNNQAMKAFVESYPPEDIYLANSARRHLNKKVYKKRVPQLPDARWPKRPLSPYIMYLAEKLKGHVGSPVGAIGGMSREWKSLGTAGQRPWVERYEKESEAYRKVSEELYRKVAEKRKDLHRDTFRGVNLAGSKRAATAAAE